MKFLEHLFLGSNALEDINFFSNINLKSLTHLSLFNNKIKNIAPLKDCFFPYLEILNLSFNKIEDISCLCKAKFNYLNSLYLNDNQIKNINNLNDAFPLLQILDLENNLISDINVFSKVLFINSIKELYLDNNPIAKYEDLNLSYFPSLKKISFSKIKNQNLNLLLLSIKMKLFGYELEKDEEVNRININTNNKISILFIPKKYFDNIYYNYDKLNSKNTFKIITDSDITRKELEEFFINEIVFLHGEKMKENIFDENIGKSKDFNNYSILCYLDEKK